MRKLFVLMTIFITPLSQAHCFDIVGKKYRLDPDYLRAIAWKESKYKRHAIGKNNDGTQDIGIMQINTANYEWLKKTFPALSTKKLLNDACFNIQVGGYILNENFKLYGRKWVAVGAYNAGGKNNPKRIKIRYQYARAVSEYYESIKTGSLRLPRIY